jgi:hypothetical protein
MLSAYDDEGSPGTKHVVNSALAVVVFEGVHGADDATVLVFHPGGERLGELLHELGMGWTVTVWRCVWAMLLAGAARRPWGVAHVYRPRRDPALYLVLPSRDQLCVPSPGFRLLVGGGRDNPMGLAPLHHRVADACLRVRGIPPPVARFMLHATRHACPVCCLRHSFFAPLRVNRDGAPGHSVDIVVCGCQ